MRENFKTFIVSILVMTLIIGTNVYASTTTV
jgi:hypothetical protein